MGDIYDIGPDHNPPKVTEAYIWEAYAAGQRAQQAAAKVQAAALRQDAIDRIAVATLPGILMGYGKEVMFDFNRDRIVDTAYDLAEALYEEGMRRRAAGTTIAAPGDSRPAEG